MDSDARAPVYRAGPVRSLDVAAFEEPGTDGVAIRARFGATWIHTASLRAPSRFALTAEVPLPRGTTPAIVLACLVALVGQAVVLSYPFASAYPVACLGAMCVLPLVMAMAIERRNRRVACDPTRLCVGAFPWESTGGIAPLVIARGDSVRCMVWPQTRVSLEDAPAGARCEEDACEAARRLSPSSEFSGARELFLLRGERCVISFGALTIEIARVPRARRWVARRDLRAGLVALLPFAAAAGAVALGLAVAAATPPAADLATDAFDTPLGLQPDPRIVRADAPVPARTLPVFFQVVSPGVLLEDDLAGAPGAIGSDTPFRAAGAYALDADQGPFASARPHLGPFGIDELLRGSEAFSPYDPRAVLRVSGDDPSTAWGLRVRRPPSDARGVRGLAYAGTARGGTGCGRFTDGASPPASDRAERIALVGVWTQGHRALARGVLGARVDSLARCVVGGSARARKPDALALFVGADGAVAEAIAWPSDTVRTHLDLACGACVASQWNLAGVAAGHDSWITFAVRASVGQRRFERVRGAGRPGTH